MDVQDLGAWGEFIGGISGSIAAIAVVASLIYVGVQLRQSTMVAKAAARQATSDAIVAYFARMVDPKLLEDAVSEMMRLDPSADLRQMDHAHFRQLNSHAQCYWRMQQNVFYQYHTGLLDEDEWRSHRSGIRRALENRRTWARYLFSTLVELWQSGILSKRFEAQVLDICRELNIEVG